MSMKDNLRFDENVEKITTALDKAVPEGSKSYEVVFALCILLAHIFFNMRQENLTKAVFCQLINDTLKNILNENENK